MASVTVHKFSITLATQGLGLVRIKESLQQDFKNKFFADHSVLTQKSTHKLAPDFGTITATLDILLAAGRTSLLHPTATQTSPRAKAFR